MDEEKVRIAKVDVRAIEQLGLAPPRCRGRSAPRRPAGRLHSFLVEHGQGLTQPPAGGAAGPGSVAPSHVVMPEDLRRLESPAFKALSALRLSIGAGVMAVLMDYCELGDLQTLACGRDSPFLASPSWPLHVAQRALLRTAREVASALAALHAAGTVHGALRPSNVLLAASAADRRGFEARVADAGAPSLEVAANNPLAAGPGMVMLSPEALLDAGSMRTTAADVYAYGMLLYVMAAGEMPFAGQHLVAVLMALASDEGLQPEWPTGQHDHLEPLFRACIAPSPEERPSARQVLEEILQLELEIKESKRARKCHHVNRAKTAVVSTHRNPAGP
ncbi:hypothetical protein GPECTOR_21g616 [Gonium pectorale]|uniref:Protein kinase domain-containing protein n=1 Tax=Gonium pectorale TaxID=33097 RepID=A0A150GIY9_GONPE|nr:hypothetical protein GPECTOR_21g616 [Gonium pectorale]|eukprot:KXZ49390.1 hypothetical protein GPECTOR_21g616 [Gonium pectorale]